MSSEKQNVAAVLHGAKDLRIVSFFVQQLPLRLLLTVIGLCRPNEQLVHQPLVRPR